MPTTPVPLADRMIAFGSTIVFAITIFGIATLIHLAISKRDDRKQIQGKPIRWWVTLMYVVGSCYGIWLADNQSYHLHEVVGGMGGFGLLLGLVIGNIHGAIDLFRSRNRAGSLALTPEADSTNMDASKLKENPYSPPRTIGKV